MTNRKAHRHGVIFSPSEVIHRAFEPSSEFSYHEHRSEPNFSQFQVSTLQLPADRKTKREQLAAQHGKVSRTKSLKMKILGSNEELAEGATVNPNPTTKITYLQEVPKRREKVNPCAKPRSNPVHWKLGWDKID